MLAVKLSLVLYVVRSRVPLRPLSPGRLERRRIVTRASNRNDCWTNCRFRKPLPAHPNDLFVVVVPPSLWNHNRTIRLSPSAIQQSFLVINGVSVAAIAGHCVEYCRTLHRLGDIGLG